MRLHIDVANALIRQAAERLDGGALVIVTADGDLAQELVRVPLPSPAFNPPFDGQALGHPLPPTPIAVTGDAARARLETASGAVFAELTLGTEDVEQQPDVIVERTDFHRGGLCTIGVPLVLTMKRLS